VLDDVFSALDANTEETVWDALFHPERGLLRGKSVFLATHGSEFFFPSRCGFKSTDVVLVHRLEKTDYIIMLAQGRIVEHGTDLLARAGPTAELVRKYVSLRNEASDTAAPAAVAADETAAMDNAIEEEQHVDEGKRETVRWDTSGFYLGSVRWWRAALYLALCVASSLVPLAINIYQTYWMSSFSVRLPFLHSLFHSILAVLISPTVYYLGQPRPPRALLRWLYWV
jgi:hypothetical protein